MEKTDARTLQGFVAKHTAEGAQVYTDDAKAAILILGLRLIPLAPVMEYLVF